MAEEINQPKIPFLQLPYNIQCTIARKLSVEDFHKLIIASKFTKEFRDWVLPSDFTLIATKPYIIFRPRIILFQKRIIEFNSFEEFKFLCCIKFADITIPDPCDVLEEFIEFLRSSSRRIRTNMLVISDEAVDHGELFVDLIKLLKPECLRYYSIFIPSCLLNFLPTYEFDHISLLNQPEIPDLFKSLKFTSFSCYLETVPPMDIIKVIEEALSGKRSRDTELSFSELEERTKNMIFEHFRDRRSLLYSPETHDLSKWSDKRRMNLTCYILYSEFSANSLWIMLECDDGFNFRKIEFEDFEKSLDYL